MSIYSGFSTRQTEQTYNNLLLKTFALLQHQLLQYINKQEKPEILNTFSIKFLRVIKKLKQYEDRKYLPPKFTIALDQLASKLQGIYREQGQVNQTVNLSQHNYPLSIVDAPSNKLISPLEVHPKYKVLYTSQTHNKIYKTNQTPRDISYQQGSQSRRRNTIIAGYEAKPPLPRKKQEFPKPQIQQRTIDPFKPAIKPITIYSEDQYNNNNNTPSQNGSKNLNKLKEKWISREIDPNRKPFLQKIKQRIRTQEKKKQSTYQ